MNRIAKPTILNIKIFKTNRDKLTRLLLNKISLLDMRFYKAKSIADRDVIKVALEKLENLLKLQAYINQNISEVEYESIKKFVYQTIKTASFDLK